MTNCDQCISASIGRTVRCGEHRCLTRGASTCEKCDAVQAMTANAWKRDDRLAVYIQGIRLSIRSNGRRGAKQIGSRTWIIWIGGCLLVLGVAKSISVLRP